MILHVKEPEIENVRQEIMIQEKNAEIEDGGSGAFYIYLKKKK